MSHQASRRVDPADPISRIKFLLHQQGYVIAEENETRVTVLALLKEDGSAVLLDVEPPEDAEDGDEDAVTEWWLCVRNENDIRMLNQYVDDKAFQPTAEDMMARVLEISNPRERRNGS